MGRLSIIILEIIKWIHYFMVMQTTPKYDLKKKQFLEILSSKTNLAQKA